MPYDLDSVPMVTTRERKPRRDSMVTGHLLVMISIGVAVGILILIGVLLFVGLDEVAPSSPSVEELGAVVGNDKAVETFKQLRQERFDSIRGLIQLLVVALAVPMLTLVLSYFFSDRQPADRPSRSGGPGNKDPVS
ncbi:MAG TPA: hypothetical protein VM754_04480 [Actinomycetota bacterium]|nr:hypothetical protein [Actinomycetota bacterium]